MKKLIVIAAVLVTALAAKAQGVIDFRNSSITPQAPVFEVGGAALVGTSYVAQLYWGAGATAPASSLTAVSDPASPFRVGPAGAGFWNATANSADANRVVGVAVNAPVTLQVRVWNLNDGATFAIANTKVGAHTGQSGVFSVNAGDPGVAPNPPSPALMNGLTSFTLTTVVPEPSTIALGLLGAGALLLRRRK